MSSNLVSADPGMWPYNRLPLKTLLERYGFEPTQEWIDRLQFGSVRVDSGGSGSFASAHGLVATNHHVAVSALEQISTPENDYLKNGFTAGSLDEEIKIPNYPISVLQSIEDITAEVTGASDESMTPYEAKRARERKIAEIEDRIFNETGEKVEVVNLFSGRFFHLYRYKRYTDVRLAFAPENQAGFFGGDEANFNYPRHVLDEALFRVYEDGKPVEVKYFIPWNSFGSREGELLFVSGHPGSTDRYLTSAQLAYERDVRIPMIIELLESRRAALKAYSSQSEESARQAKANIFGLENSLKVYRGMAEALKSPGVVEQREQEEKDFVEAAVEAGYSEVPRSLLRIHRGVEKMAALRKLSLLAGSIGVNSSLFSKALSIVRYHSEMPLDNLDRRSDFREANLDQFFMRLYAKTPFHAELEVAKLVESLSWLVKEMSLDEEIVRSILGLEEGEAFASEKERAEKIQARARELIESSQLHDIEFRKTLIEGGASAIEASTDPWIVLVRKIMPLMDQIVERIINETGGQISKAHRELFRVREEMGEELAPDATFTLRMSFGTVKPYIEMGLPLPAYTQMGQAFDQAKARGNKGDWELPASWWEALERGEVDVSVPINLVSDHDTTGGNSGSPVVNQFGQKVGILFDGNRHGVGMDKFVPPVELSRSVSVDCRLTLSALAGIYQARWFVNELVGGARPYSQ